MAARFITNKYTNRRGKVRVSALMSFEDALLLAVEDDAAVAQLSQAITAMLDREAEREKEDTDKEDYETHGTSQ